VNKKAAVLAAINHEPTGCLPFDLFEGWLWPQIEHGLMDRLIARDHDDLLTKLGVYCRWVTAEYVGPSLPPGAMDRIASPHTTHSLNASIWGLAPGLKMHGSESEGHPLAQARSAGDILNHTWPSPDWFDYEGASRQARRYGDHFVVLGGFTPVFYLMADLCGMQETLVSLLKKPAFIEALVQKIGEFYRGYTMEIAATCQGSVDAIAFGDDFASQRAMLFSPVLWRRFFRPLWEELFGIARKSGFKVFFHSCGSIAEVIPDLIDAGLDVLYPIQPTAQGMDIAGLKRRFGDLLSFYGGIDVQGLLPFGTPKEVAAEVERVRALFEQTGGYILSTSHVLMDDVPLENAMALYTSARGAAS
jgi:uroporphyrinogen decarboxylase